MTISSTTRQSGPYIGNGTTSVYPFVFKVFYDSDLIVVQTNLSGTETVLDKGTHYVVSLNEDQNSSPGGSITLVSALTLNFLITITSAIQPIQPVDLTNQGGFFPGVINHALDRLTILVQQVLNITRRALNFPISDGSVSPTLPSRENRKGRVLAFHETTGNPVPGPSISDVGTVGENVASINMVAGNIGNVNIVANNIVDVTNFADVYLGPKASDPVTRNDGSPLQFGDMYFSVVTNTIKVYVVGGTWVISVAAPSSGSIEFLPPGIGAVSRSVYDKLIEYVTVKNFGAKGDGVTDDSLAFSKALDHAALHNVALYVPSGIYFIPTWTTKNISSINMIGDGYYATKIVTTTNTITNKIFANLTGGGISVEGIHFENFYRVFYFNATLEYVRIHKCRGVNNRSYFISSAAYSQGNPASVVGNVFISDNVIENCLGFCIFSKVDQVIMTGNRMRDVKVNQTLWGNTGHDTNVFGLCVGDGSNKASVIGNYNMKNIVVADNDIYNVYNNSEIGTLNTTNAIMVSGQFVSITGNVINGMTAVDGGNCEAIYTKCLTAVISNNTITDGTVNSACIAIKGAAYGMISKDVLVSDNVIKNVANESESGIITYGIDSVSISGNLISNMYGDSIKIYGSPTKLSIIDNIIYQDEGLSAISIRANDLYNAIIQGNVITGFSKSIPASEMLKVIWVSSRGKVLKTVVPDSPGSGYTSSPVIDFTNPIGGGTTNTEVSISGGQVVGFHVINSTQEFDMTAAVTSSITGGGGSGATAIATVSQGVISNLHICKNQINISPKHGGSAEACGILIQAMTDSNDNFSGIVVEQNSIHCDTSTTFQTYPYVVGLSIIPPENKIISDIDVRGVKVSGPNVGSNEGVTPLTVKVGSTKYIKPYEAASKFGVFSVGSVFVNGTFRQLLSACNIEDGRVTIVIPVATFGSIGSHQVGFIPYPCQITKAMLFVASNPSSVGGLGTIALSAGYAASKNILASTLANSTNFPSAGWTDCKPDFTKANAIRSFLSSVPIYIDIGIEDITSGLMVLTLYTEAMP